MKTASIPSRKASFSCLCLTHVTSLAFLVQGHFEKQLVSDFARKNEMSGTFEKKSKQTTLVSTENILCLAIVVKETCASTIFNSILKGNLKVLGNKKNAQICRGVWCQKNDTNFLLTAS